MAQLFDCTDPAQMLTGSREARQAIARGELIVVPTDTVYGVAADAFDPRAVEKLLAAKGRGREAPPPVLVASMAAVAALAESVPEAVEKLAEEYWPGPLTIILPAQPSLNWDLGDTGGTVALRIPDHDLTLEILRETGPLAVSSANLHGEPPARTADEAERMLGESVQVILDGGSVSTGVASTIVDATKLDESRLRILRPGGVSLEQLAGALPEYEISIAPTRPPAKPASE